MSVNSGETPYEGEPDEALDFNHGGVQDDLEAQEGEE